jgi:hypothetical protein
MTTPENPGKVVVFDMDETLGYFIQFSYFWENLKVYFNEQNNAVKLKQLEDNFKKILGLYPEDIRPNISKYHFRFVNYYTYINFKK